MKINVTSAEEEGNSEAVGRSVTRRHKSMESKDKKPGRSKRE